MARAFHIPAIDEGVESVELASLNVSTGDVLEAGSVVAEVETDKAAADLEIDFGGTVTEIHAAPGDTVLVGAVLLTVEESGGGESIAATTTAAESTAESPAAAPPVPVPVETSDAVETSDQAVAATPAVASSPNEETTPAPAGPATRRLARQLGVDLQRVSGTAAGGRITQADVTAHVKSVMEGGTPNGGGQTPPPLPDFSRWGPTERVPLNRIGRAAAANLSLCWNVIPHVTQHDLIDITDLEAARRRMAAAAVTTGAPKVTMTAIAMKAAAICLKEFPQFNAALDPLTDELVYRRYFHIGCAVDTPDGLLVPVVPDCDRKSISEIAAALSEVAARARDGKVKLSEMQGACLTVTNLGGIGGTAFTPIVNYPEVAILGMSRGRTELKRVAGEIEERLMLPLSLSYDHRVINGAAAARFVVRLGQLLNEYFHLTIQS